MELKEHYNRMWRHALVQFRSNEFEFDPMIDAAEDTRYGITLLARPPEKVKESVVQTLKEIESVAPGPYYYPGPDLHVTILSIISCSPGFTIDEINHSEYCGIIEKAVDSIPPFRIDFRGITASPSTVLIQGFPEDGRINRLRDILRKEFRNSGLQHSIDTRYHLRTAHMTAIRFKKPFRETDTFIRKISGLREQEFGSCLVDRLELIGNDWYQREEKVQRIKEFELVK